MPIDRRTFLTGALAVAGAALAGCGGGDNPTLSDAPGSGAGAPASAAPSTAPPPPTTVAATTTAPTTTTFRGVARYVNRGTATGQTPRAALSFHTEGTVAQVGRLLDMAQALDVPLTLLIVGSWLEATPSLAPRLAASRHDLGNHTYSHLALPSQSRSVVAAEIAKGADVMQRLLGTRGRWFRPTGSNSTTDVINEEAGKAGYPVVLGFDTDPLDYQDPGAATVRSRVLASTKAGSIVSLHAQHQGTIDVFESMVTGLRDKGFTLVRASDLVAI